MSNNNFQPSTFTPFRSGCGMCKPSTDYYNQTGAGNYSEDGLIPVSNGENLFQYPEYQLSLDNKFVKDNYGIDYATSFGGAKKSKGSKKSKSDKQKVTKKPTKPGKKMKGGEESSGATSLPMRYFNSDIQTNTVEGNDIGLGNLAPYASEGGAKSSKKTAPKKKTASSTKTAPKKKIPSKKMKGGMESSGATPMNQRFYDVNATLDNYPEFSGNGINSAYGPIESGDIGTGMLAPYTASTCSSANSNTDMKTGGGKKSSKTSAKTSSKTSSKTSLKKDKSKSIKKSKSMKGGMESSGATPMNQRFYDVNANLDNYPELSGNGVMSAYGPIESGDIGVGMLAPYTSANCASANPNTTMKTGGAKSKKSVRKHNGGDGPIPYISDNPVSSIQNAVTGAINGFSSFMQQLDADYLKSVQYAESIKIGNQRLIQGGKKATSKKTPSKKAPKKKVGGSTGSDFVTTLGSRGPSNAPDDYWGVPGEEWFRQFNKTGDYIPNSQLPYAATPELAGMGHSAVVSGYDDMSMGTNFGDV